MYDSVFSSQCCFSSLNLDVNSVHLFSIYCALAVGRSWDHKGELDIDEAVVCARVTST